MACWKIEFCPEAAKEFTKLDKDSQRLIQNYLNKKVLKLKNPKDLGKALKHNFKGYWRYRVDKFRIICQLKNETFIVLVLKIGKRDEVYEE